MKIETRYLGSMEIEREDIIYFPEGLLGFQDYKNYVILRIEENSQFMFLQSVDEKAMAFLIINPWDFFLDYNIDLPNKSLEIIDFDTKVDKNLAIYSIVTLGETLKESTCNLLAPIVINVDQKKGRQVILNNSPYITTHELFKKEEPNVNTK